MTAKKRFAAALLAALCLVLVAVPFLMAAEARHDCCGEGCEICERLAAAGDALRGAGLVLFLTLLTALPGEKALRTAKRAVFGAPVSTPVTLKVKLSN